MIVSFKNNGKALELEAEDDLEMDYLRVILDRVYYTYDPTYITYINGVKIVSKGENK